MAKDESVRENILAAIRRAAEEMGRAPSRGELRRITGVSHYRVLAEFKTLREAVRAAGLEPNPKGEKISTEDLIKDWTRVAEKLGRRPSRAEYVREGKYSAGALTIRFGSWGKIGEKTYHGDTEARRTAKRSGDLVIGRSGDHPTTRKPRAAGAPGDRRTRAATTASRRLPKSEDRNREGSGGELSPHHAKSARVGGPGEFTLHNFDHPPLAQLPAPLVGMRRVTEEVAQLVVNTLLAPGNWHLAISQNQSLFTTEATEEHGGGKDGRELTRRTQIGEGEPAGCGTQSGNGGNEGMQARENGRPGIVGVRKDRAVMGAPFDVSPMTNAPVNELGVMVLFGIGDAAGVAGGVGAGEVSGLRSQARSGPRQVAVSAD